jgi:2-polyprenyl-3-methyl-5-hydroxy-6-metoxy-1,4-benzoquinol methylase
MGCCCLHSEAKDKFFSRCAKRYAKQYRRRGLDKAQLFLFEGITQAIYSKNKSLTQKTFLEIGCGAGGLLISLVQKGASHATGIEASHGMLETAQQLAKDVHVDDRIEFFYGDFEQMQEKVQRVDVAILDKVLCCDASPHTLIEHSAAKAKEIYAVSFPRESFFARAFIRAGILCAKLFRINFVPFYHEPRQLQQWIEAQGFRSAYVRNTILWEIVIFKRTA